MEIDFSNWLQDFVQDLRSAIATDLPLVLQQYALLSMLSLSHGNLVSFRFLCI